MHAKTRPSPKEQAYELFDKFMGFKMNPYDDPEMALKIGKVKEQCRIAIEYCVENHGDEDGYQLAVLKEIEKI